MGIIKQFAASALVILGLLLGSFSVLSVQGQTVNSYIANMGDALAPYGTIKGANCHNLEMDLFGPWGDYAIPDGINREKPDELTWRIFKVNLLRVYVNLSDLDEDKVLNQSIFSMEDAGHHKTGAPYVPDTPSVFIATSGLNSEMTVYTVDLHKVEALSGQHNVTESQWGTTLDERRGATILFSDQAHADAFQKAIQKAIVVCKAQ